MSTIQETITTQVQIATTAVNTANARLLDTLVEANRTAVDFAVKTAERLPRVELPAQLPFSLTVPTATETGERYLDFVERAVSVNRDFGDRVAKMLPADIAPKAAEKRSTKTTAKK
ncbi:MAG: hypothetical protein ACE37B_09305 [Ilumatobacter sp.]|jgi:hypothetical protein|uniref:hypothetical protein n=1 Tax=Ilumatobacter sp. TaxID=1967498 RepID=UPI00391BBC72